MNPLASGHARLLIRPKIAENESLRGYVSRVSRRNGSSPLLNPMLVSLKVTTNAVQKIATLTGCRASILKQHGSLTQVHNDVPAGVLFGSCILSINLVRGHQRVVCPKCLSKNGVSNCCWELRDYDVCHEHGCYLVGRCSGCDRQISWASTPSGMCCCGIRLADMKTKMASTTRGLVCRLIADAMSASISRSNQKENVSDSLTPLNWLFIVSNFVLSILIPGFCQEHLGNRRALGKQTSEELLLIMLKDSEYYGHLRQLMFPHTARNQMTMARALRVGIFDQELRETFLPCFKRVIFHDHLLKMKADLQKMRELNFRRTPKLVRRARRAAAGIT